MGIWLGFHSAVALVPDEGIGVVALTNTGPFSPFAATGPVADAVLRSLPGLPQDVPVTGVPERPWDWDELCGSYSFGPGILTDPQPRMLGPAVQVVASRDHLVVRGQLPVPAIRRGLRLYPDAGDPDVFRVILPGFGFGMSLVVFSRDSAGEVTGMHLGMQPMSFRKRRRPTQRPGRALTPNRTGRVTPADRYPKPACHGHRTHPVRAPEPSTSQLTCTKAQLTGTKNPLCPGQRVNAESGRLAGTVAKKAISGIVQSWTGRFSRRCLRKSGACWSLGLGDAPTIAMK